MAQKLDSIYGTDDNGFANRISSNALSTSGKQGSVVDDDARSKGTNDSGEDAPVKIRKGLNGK